MLTEQESKKLMEDLIELRNTAKKTNDKKDLEKLKRHETKCIDKFKYLILMRTGKYKQFPNYDDLNQEGFEALLKAMDNYNPSKGSFFFWAHKYIETRISRSANLHTAIRYPLKFAKQNAPKKEYSFPLLIENKLIPDKNLEETQLSNSIKQALSTLNSDQKNIINLVFGFENDQPLSINKICKKMKISRVDCLKTMKSALSAIKQNIKL